MRYASFFKDKIDEYKIKKDSQIRNGVVDKRQMTDQWWMLFALIFWMISLGLDIDGYNRGNWRDVMANYDGE